MQQLMNYSNFVAVLPPAFVELQPMALLLHSGMMISVTFVAISFLMPKEFHFVEAPLILYGYSISLLLSLLLVITGNLVLKSIVLSLLIGSASSLFYLTTMIVNGWIKTQLIENIKSL